MKNLKVLELKGIDRSGGRFTDQGILQEALNVNKRRSGLYEVIGKKDVIEEYVADLESYLKLYRFPSLPSSDLIGVLTDQKVYRVTPGAATQILAFTGTFQQVTHLGNILIVHTSDSSYNLKYNPDTDAFTELPAVPIPQFMVEEDPERDGSFATGDFTTLAEAIAEYTYRYSELGKDGYTEGNIICTMAYRLFDNSYVKHSQLVHCQIGGVAGNLLNVAGGVYNMVGTYAKLWGKYQFTAAELVTLAKYKGIISSMCLFISQPLSKFNADTDIDLYVDLGGDLKQVPPNTDTRKMDQKALAFYKIHEIALDEITSGSGAEEFWPNIGPLDLLVTTTPLPVDESTHHQFSASHALLYNNRIHFSNLKTVLSLGLNMNAFADNEWDSSTGTFYSLMNYRWGYAGYTPVAPTDTWTVVLLTRIQTSEGERVRLRYLYQDEGDVTVWEHATNPDIILLNTILSYPDIRATSMTIYLITGGNFYRHSTVGLTPHPMHNFASYINWDEVNKKPIPYELDLTAPGDAIIPETFLSEAGTTGGAIYDTNRIQLTGLNNPFIFPAANSYRIGSHGSIVLATAAMGEAISQGQFGQFPLYVFSSQGIWTLQLGNGEVIYSAILPLNSDVVSNLNSITNVGAGVVYATSRGLFIISGTQVSELSTAVEGKLDNPVLSHNEYLGYLYTDCLVMLKDYLSDITFSTYLESAIIGFDRKNRELIVSFKEYNDLHDWQGSGSGSGGYNWPGTGVGIPMVDDASKAGYSYVYSFLNKEWTKITQRWYHFIDAYPDTLAVVGNCMYNLTIESTEPNQYLVQTRPITLSQHTFKKILSANLYGHFEPEVNTFHAFYVWGSQDGRVWHLLQGQQQPYSPHEWVTIQRAEGWCKYFIFLATGQMSQDSILEHMEIEFDERYKSKLR